MFKNYIMIAWKVLLRRKFFTFVSLFGTGFTLLVLMVGAAFLEQLIRPAKPGSRFDRTVFVDEIELKGPDMHVSSFPSYYFLDKYVRPMVTPEAVSIHSTAGDVNVYVGARKLTLGMKYTDDVFWDIIEFPFIEGRPFDAAMVENAEKVAVITDRTRADLFGDRPALGEYIETSAGDYRVIGIIPNSEIPTYESSGDIYVPITTSRSEMTGRELFSNCHAFVLARSKDDFGAIRQEFDKRMDKAREDLTGGFDQLWCDIHTQADVIAANLSGSDGTGGAWLMAGQMIGIGLLFMLLPAINLVNINVSRIIERSSEIGVRKAFGASRRTLLGQFIIENIFLTLFAGGIAFILAWVTIAIVNDSGLLPFGHLGMNPSVVMVCLGLSLFFGVFSGVIPAYRMSRLNAVDALRGGAV
jgi:putative ABC transport system permease protein